jgi:hypothetical protein
MTIMSLTKVVELKLCDILEKISIANFWKTLLYFVCPNKEKMRKLSWLLKANLINYTMFN